MTTLTDDQAAHLNRLSAASGNLRKALRDLRSRTDELLSRAEQGHHLQGFDSDVLGQCGREVQHYASVRLALLSVNIGIDDDMLIRALTLSGSGSLPIYFRAGEQPETV